MIYLDYHATTPVDPRVADRIYQVMTRDFGNASSLDHAIGDRAATAIDQAAHQVATLIGARPREIIWTSGATESLNLALQGYLTPDPRLFPPPQPPRRVALLPIEHKAVLDTCKTLEKRGLVTLTYLKVDRQGQLDLNHLEQVCAAGLDLLCVMAANNEIGTIYPMEAIGQIARRYRVPFLCDATQAVGKIPLHCTDWGITYLALSAHKLYGPQGIGALIVRTDQIHQIQPLQPLLCGGDQQRGTRPGTLNLPGIVGLGAACHLRSIEMAADEAAIAQKRDTLQTILLQRFPHLVINGDREHRLAGNLHIAIPGIPNSAIIARIRHQLAISTGSACTSGVEAPSHVLRSLQLPTNLLEGALRISIGKFTTDPEIQQAANILIAAIAAVSEKVS